MCDVPCVARVELAEVRSAATNFLEKDVGVAYNRIQVFHLGAVTRQRSLVATSTSEKRRFVPGAYGQFEIP